jgi:hypothetical protein
MIDLLEKVAPKFFINKWGQKIRDQDICWSVGNLNYEYRVFHDGQCWRYIAIRDRNTGKAEKDRGEFYGYQFYTESNHFYLANTKTPC